MGIIYPKTRTITLESGKTLTLIEDELSFWTERRKKERSGTFNALYNYLFPEIKNLTVKLQRKQPNEKVHESD